MIISYSHVIVNRDYIIIYKIASPFRGGHMYCVTIPSKAFPLRATKCGAGVNDSPVGCQSRAVTEPQREKTRLEFDLPPHKKT